MAYITPNDFSVLIDDLYDIGIIAAQPAEDVWDQ